MIEGEGLCVLDAYPAVCVVRRAGAHATLPYVLPVRCGSRLPRGDGSLGFRSLSQADMIPAIHLARCEFPRWVDPPENKAGAGDQRHGFCAGRHVFLSVCVASGAVNAPPKPTTARHLWPSRFGRAPAKLRRLTSAAVRRNQRTQADRSGPGRGVAERSWPQHPLAVDCRLFPDHLRCRIVDVNDRAIVDTDHALIGSKLERAERFRRCPQRRVSCSNSKVVYGAPKVYDVKLPIQREGQPFGVIRVGISTVFLKNEVKPRLTRAIGLSILAILVSLGAGCRRLQHCLATAGGHWPPSRPDDGGRSRYPTRAGPQGHRRIRTWSTPRSIAWAGRSATSKKYSARSRKTSTRSWARCRTVWSCSPATPG